MKIAVASSNGSAISKHFGRSAYFIVYSIDDGKIIDRELRRNTFTPHMTGQNKPNEHHDTPNAHSGVVGALGDCEAILCYGMGMRAAQDLRVNKIKALVLPHECTPDEAVRLYLQGGLQENTGGFCEGHKH